MRLASLKLGRRWLRHPLFAIVLAIVLVADVLLLPAWRYEGGVSIVGKFVKRDLLGLSPSAIVHAREALNWYFVRKESGIQIVPPEDAGWDDGARLLKENPGGVLQLQYRDGWSREGFWALTRDITFRLIEARFNSQFTPTEVVQARHDVSLALTQTYNMVDQIEATRLASGNVEHARVIWVGYIHNTVTLIVAALFSFSCAMIPKWYRESRAFRAGLRGVCARCGYSLAGLRGQTCPECGTRPAVRAQEKDPGIAPES